jgi:adenylate cyclase
VVTGLAVEVPEAPWPPLPPDAWSEEQARRWLLPPVYERLHLGEFLAELRPAVALFLRFGGIDYDRDEGAADKLSSFIRQVEEILRRYEGSLIQVTLGDKGSYLYAAFGAPVAHEDDAIRASSAALELRTLAARLGFLTPPQIGITQGRMRTGAYGSTTRRTYGVLGDATNLSARLMQTAEPGEILVSQLVRESTGNAFAWEERPAVMAKGKSEPVAVARLVGGKEQPAIHLLEPQYALPMVGREAELTLLAAALRLARQGHGQVVGLTAEAGLGKSRLAAEVIRLAAEQGFGGFGGECQSYGMNTSHLPWHTIWRRLFDLNAGQSLAEQVKTLETRLERINPAFVPRLPLLGSVLNLSIPDNDFTRTFDAKLRKSSLEALLVDCLRTLALEQPLLLVIEDCHWLDPLSHDLIEQVARAIGDLPVFMLLVYRPPGEHQPQVHRLSQLPYFTEVELTEFTPGEAERLIHHKLAQLLGDATSVPPGFVAQITERAAGNPFYIEELLNYLRDRAIDPQNSQALASLDLPSSLHSLVLTRIERHRQAVPSSDGPRRLPGTGPPAANRGPSAGAEPIGPDSDGYAPAGVDVSLQARDHAAGGL